MELERLLVAQLILFGLVVLSVERYAIFTGFLLGCNLAGVVLLIASP